MRKWTLIILVTGFVYIMGYSALRFTGVVHNTNYYMNNFQTRSYIALIYAVPGCIVENIVFYSYAFGWRGTLGAFSELRISHTDGPFISTNNDILWWSWKFG